MKIVVDLTQLADNLSGLERYAMCITREMILLDRKNEYVLLYKNHVCEMLADIHERENVTCRVYQGKRKLIFNQVKLPLYLYRERKADKYLFLAFPCPLLFRKKGIYALVADLTCWDMPETMKKKAEIYFKATIRHSVRVSEKIVTISEFSKQRIMEHFGGNDKTTKRYQRLEEKIILAYCGVSDAFTRLQPCDGDRERTIREKYHLPEEYFLCLSTLEPRKNLKLLIEAYRRLLCQYVRRDVMQNDNMRDIQKDTEAKSETNMLQVAAVPRLVLAGRKGWLIDELLADIEREYPNQVVVTGFIEDEDLPYIYEKAACFIFPSMYEGFGMPPLEALAVGTPVISSDAASLPEVLGEHADYFESGNANALKDRMLAFLHDNKAESTEGATNADGTGGRGRYVDSRFDWKKSAERILVEIMKRSSL